MSGAYDGEMKQIVKEVNVMDQAGNILTLNNETMEFGYRSSVIRNRPFIMSRLIQKKDQSGKFLIIWNFNQAGRLSADAESRMPAHGFVYKAVLRGVCVPCRKGRGV